MYARANLSANRLIDRKMRIRTLEVEKKRLSHYQRHAAPSHTLLQSPTVKRLSKLKRSTIEQVKNTEIERSNRILLEKISTIANGKGQYNFDGRARRLSEYYRKRSKDRTATQNSKDTKQLRIIESLYPSPNHSRQGSPDNHTRKPHISFKDLNDRKYMVHRNSRNLRGKQRLLSPLPQSNKQVLYRGERTFDVKAYLIEAYLQAGQFVFRAEQKHGQLVKYMYMDQQDYRRLRKEYLPNGILSLFQYIRIDDVVELHGMNKMLQTSTILELPSKEAGSTAHRYNK